MEKLLYGLILFAIGIIIYIFFYLIVCGYLFDLAPDYATELGFHNKYLQFWKNMTSNSRFILTRTYYTFYTTLITKLREIRNKNNNNILSKYNMTVTEYISDFSLSYVYHTNIPLIIVSVIPKDNPDKNDITLVICSHFDGHNLTDGGTAYDDAIHTVSMVGVLDILASKNIEINSRIDFVFDGGEEIGLIGAYQYVEYLNDSNRLNEKYDYLNLEAMGAGFPYVFIIRSKTGGYRVQSALLSTPGTVFLPFNFILDSGFVGSSTDHAVFDKYNWTGGVNVFVGKSSAYHTRYDSIKSGREIDIKLAINQLITFISNYDPTVSNGFIDKSFCYGIAPISIILPDIAVYIIEGLIAIAAIVTIILKERHNKKEFFFDLLKGFILFIIFIIFFIVQGLFVYLANPLSPGDNQAFVYLTPIQGLCLLLLLQKFLKVQKFCRFRLVLDIILMASLGWTDFSIFISLLTIFSILFYAFDFIVTKMIFGFFQYFVCALFFAVTNQLILQMSSRMGDLIGSLLIFLIYLLFAYHLVASPFDFYKIEIPQLPVEGESRTESVSYKELNTMNDEYDNDSLNTNLVINEYIPRGKKKKCVFLKKIKTKFVFLILEIIFILFLLIFFLIKPAPFSSDFILPVKFMHLYDIDKNTSEFICYPLSGIDYLKETFKENSELNIEVMDIERYKLGIEGDCLSLHDKSYLPENFTSSCIIPNDISGLVKSFYNESTVEFAIKINQTMCINSIFIYINPMDGNEIVKKDNQEFNQSVNGHFDLSLRSGKINPFWNYSIDDSLDDFEMYFNFTLKNNVKELEFTYTIYLESMDISDEYLSFQNNFGEGVSQIQANFLSGTIFKYNSFAIKKPEINETSNKTLNDF